MSESSQRVEAPNTPTATQLTSTSPQSFVSFTVEIKVFMTEEQYNWLRQEVERRKDYGQTSPVPAARGANRNVNMSMLVREALELQYGISLTERGAA